MGMAGETTTSPAPIAPSHRRRIGFNATHASSAVAKFIAMMIAKKGIHDPVASWTSPATGPPSTHPIPWAMWRNP